MSTRPDTSSDFSTSRPRCHRPTPLGADPLLLIDSTHWTMTMVQWPPFIMILVLSAHNCAGLVAFRTEQLGTFKRRKTSSGRSTHGERNGTDNGWESEGVSALPLSTLGLNALHFLAGWLAASSLFFPFFLFIQRYHGSLRAPPWLRPGMYFLFSPPVPFFDLHYHSQCRRFCLFLRYPLSLQLPFI